MNRRIASYLITGFGLTAGYVYLRGNSWVGSGQLHTLMETLATALALIVGVLALVRYYSKKNNMFLFVGTGFIGTAFLDGYHAVVTSEYFRPFMPSDNASLIPWSWIASREYLSIFMVLSWLAWRYEFRKGEQGHINDQSVYLFSLVFTIASFLFFALYPLPPAYYPDFVFHRPEEFFPALLFGIALYGYLKKGEWRHNAFEHWLVLSLIIGFVSQAVFMSFSGVLFDFEFDAAHTLKKVSYICVLIGLLFNMFHLYIQADQANQAKSDFLNIMSHELRTPLTVILGYAPILANPERLPSVKAYKALLKQSHIPGPEAEQLFQTLLDEFKGYVGKMDSSGKHLLMLINDMLDLSKIEAGKMEIIPQNLSVNGVVSSVVQQFANDAKERGLELTYDANDQIVFADEVRLKQILINLVGNALKFTEKGNIKIRTVVKGSLVHFSVSDTGCGIPSESFEGIFERFQQIDESSTRNSGGTGLGLAITKRLVELHSGTITIASRVGEGSTFSFTIPSKR